MATILDTVRYWQGKAQRAASKGDWRSAQRFNKRARWHAQRARLHDGSARPTVGG